MISKEEIETLRKILQKFDDSAKEPVSHVDQLIDQAINGFDFEKVHDYMKSVNWAWASSNFDVPNIVNLKEHAVYLLRNACSLFQYKEYKQETRVFSGSGGFEANALRKTANSEVDYVRLTFVLGESFGELR